MRVPPPAILRVCLNHSKTSTIHASSVFYSRSSGLLLESTTRRQASDPKSEAPSPKQIQSTNKEMLQPPRPGAFRALSHWDFEFASDFGLPPSAVLPRRTGGVSDLRWQAPHPSTRARHCHVEARQPNRRARGFHHIRRQCGSLSSSNCHFLPCSRPLMSLPVSGGISQRRISLRLGVEVC